jgi:two-component system sensor histidine kinase YesM
MKNLFFNKRESLKKTYYRNFILLIAVPIFLIMLFIFAILRDMVIDSAMNRVELVQENVSSTLSAEINQTMLRLSHFIHTNNGAVITLAENAIRGTDKEKYANMQHLTEAFRFMIVPTSDIQSINFLMKNGEHIYLKDRLCIPKEELSKLDWYQNAINKKGQVFINGYTGKVTDSGTPKNQLTLIAGFAPDSFMDQSRETEVIVMAVSSKVGYQILEYNKDKSLGTINIFNSDGSILFHTGVELDYDLDKETQSGGYKKRVDGTTIQYIVTEIPTTGWKIITAINYNVLQRDVVKVAIIILVVMLILFAMFAYFSSFFLRNIIHPVNEMVKGVQLVDAGNLEVHIQPFGQSEIRNMIHNFNNMVRRLGDSIEKSERNLQKKHDAEIQALQSQINPHFLVNSLNSIRFIAQISRFDNIKNMAEALINILSCSFRSNISFYTIREEIEVLESFIYLMKIRYAEGFDVTIEMEKECEEYLIPRLILQPIVENSIVHAFEEMEDIGLIHIKVYSEADCVCFEIEDNGKGMTQELIQQLLSNKDDVAKKNKSMGISNVDTRLCLNYGMDYGIKIDNNRERGTKVSLRIPKKYKNRK